MEECPNCGQTITEDDTVCPYCKTDIGTYEKSTDAEPAEEVIEESGPLTEKEKIESEILDNVIQRVDAYWARKWQEEAAGEQTDTAEKGNMTSKAVGVYMEDEGLSSRSRAIDVLGLCAWLLLVVGVIGAIVIWRSMGGLEVSSQSGVGISSYLGLAFGIASLLGGIVSCAYLLVVCLIAENIAEIRNKLLP
jgi:hypothetical protein